MATGLAVVVETTKRPAALSSHNLSTFNLSGRFVRILHASFLL